MSEARRNRRARNRAKDVRGRENSFSPKILVALGETDVFGISQESVSETIKEIPTAVVLNFALRNQLDIHFSRFAPDFHQRKIHEMLFYLNSVERRRISMLRQRHGSSLILFNTDSTLHLIYEALRNFVSFDGCEDTDIEPTDEEYRCLYRAYLKCNEEWTDLTRRYTDSLDLSLMLEVPNGEFKFYKELKPAVYKASRFFSFCENNSNYQPYLQAFYDEYDIKSWKDYVAILVSLFHATLSTPYTNIDDDLSYRLLRHFFVDVKEMESLSLWNKNIPLLYLRNHFLAQFSERTVAVISPDLLIDKIYQGLKFMMYESILKRGLLNYKTNKPFKNLGSFLGILGEDFSEDFMMKDLLEKTFKSDADVFLSKDNLANQGIKGETDFYIRKSDTLIMIEYKDNIFPDTAKYSGNPAIIRQEILERICKFGKKKKGYGQLVENFLSLDNGDYDNIDPDSRKVTNLFAIIGTTDTVFSSIGVNLLVTQEADKYITDNHLNFGTRFVSVPIIVDIDMLINISYLIAQGRLSFFQLILDYLRENNNNIMPLKAYVWEKVLKGLRSQQDEISFLMGDVIEKNSK